MPAPGHNQLNPDAAKRWLGEVLRVYDQLADLRIENMNKARTIRGRLPGIYDSAKAEGLPVKALKIVVKEELLKRKLALLEDQIEALEPDDSEDQETLDQLREALGPLEDLPLGQAAINRKAAADDDDDRDLRPRHKQQADAEHVESNVRRLRNGVTGLPGATATEA
jgi:uncharacterized protein (UPF0335 family)